VNPAIEFRRADSVAEACALLADSDDARVVSGGTALTILMRQGLVRPNLLVGVSRIEQLRHIEVNEADAMLHLGAAVPMRVAEQHRALIQRWPVLAETLRLVATPRIRNMATLGGALSHADPAQDPPVVLVALGARVLVSGRDSARVVAAADFFVDYYETALRSGEMVVGVEVPALDSAVGSIFLKYTPRSVEDYATVSACAIVELDSDRICRQARLVLGAVGPTPIVVDVAAALTGQQITEHNARAAAELAREKVDPLDDVRGSAAYKRDMAVVFGRRALLAAAHRSVLTVGEAAAHRVLP
jgi:aerobic carbon-monoxide dehydrogenase medium subunit